MINAIQHNIDHLFYYTIFPSISNTPKKISNETDVSVNMY